MERLKAAIEKLAKLKAESTPGEWFREGSEVYADKESWYGVIWSGVDGNGGLMDVNISRIGSNGNLIVTLHRTIDAQFAFLSEAYHQLTHEGEHVKGFLEHELNLFMRLADAILDN